MSPCSRGSRQLLSSRSLQVYLSQRHVVLYHSSSQRPLITIQQTRARNPQVCQLEALSNTIKTFASLYSTKATRRKLPSRRDEPPRKSNLLERSLPLSPNRSNSSEVSSEIYDRFFKDGGAPILLYRGPASNVYKFSCYALSGTCIGIALWTFYDSFVGAPPGLWWPIPYVFLVVTGVAGFIGVYVGRHGARHLQNIHAVPTHFGQTRAVLLRMQVKSLLPFWRGKVFERSLEQVSIARRIAAVNKSPLAREADMCRAIIDKKRRPFLKYGSRILWGEGFAKFWTDDNKGDDPWKLDLVNGYWGDGGQVIDRLVKLREDRATEQEDMLVVQSTKV